MSTLNFLTTGNPAVTLAAVATNGSQDISLPNGIVGLGFTVDIGTCTGTSPTLLVTVSGYDSAGNLYTLLATTAASATSPSVTQYVIGPTSAVVTNVSAQYAVPAKINVAWTIGGTTPSINGSIDLIPFRVG